MNKYSGQVVPQNNGFAAVILHLETDSAQPNYEIVKSIENVDKNTAQIWVDDEMARIKTGKGIWE
jgi:hypothetical protein